VKALTFIPLSAILWHRALTITTCGLTAKGLGHLTR